MKKKQKIIVKKHTLKLIPLLILTLILILLVNLVVYLNNRYNSNVGAAFWEHCYCENGVWVGERCPKGLINRRCDFGPLRGLTPTMKPMMLPTIDNTLPPMKPIGKPTLLPFK